MNIFLWLLLTAFLIGSFIGVVVLVWTLVSLIISKGVPFVPLDKKQLALLEKNIKLQKEDSVIDLGCGDGRVLRLFEKQGVKQLTGVEVNLSAYLQALIKNKIFRSKSKILLKDFNKIKITDHNIVFCYLLENALQELRNKFDKELRPGSKIISFAFEIKDWHKPKHVIITDKNKPNLNRIFIYEK